MFIPYTKTFNSFVLVEKSYHFACLRDKNRGTQLGMPATKFKPRSLGPSECGCLLVRFEEAILPLNELPRSYFTKTKQLFRNDNTSFPLDEHTAGTHVSALYINPSVKLL